MLGVPVHALTAHQPCATANCQMAFPIQINSNYMQAFAASQPDGFAPEKSLQQPLATQPWRQNHPII